MPTEPGLEEQMAITRSKQNWTTGQTVKVGFLSLMVVQCIPTPGDHAPDAYILVNPARTQLYRFVPHRGVEKITRDEANELIASSVEIARQQAAAAINKAQFLGMSDDAEPMAVYRGVSL